MVQWTGRVWNLYAEGFSSQVHRWLVALVALLSLQKAKNIQATTYIIKMLYLIGPHGLINLEYANFQKLAWMTMAHVFSYKIKHE